MSTISVDLEVNSVLNQIDIEDCLSYFGYGDILSHIDINDNIRSTGSLNLLESMDIDDVENFYLVFAGVDHVLSNYSTEQLMDELISRGVDISM